MTRRGLATAVLVAAPWMGGCALHSGLAAKSVNEVGEAVDRDLPPGSTRAQIEAWLAGQGVEFHYSDDPRSVPAVAALPDAGSYTGMVVGRVRDAGRLPFTTGGVRVYLLLGSDGRLARRLVGHSETGP